MKILVRLPNWLGDMVMSLGFLHALGDVYSGSEISVIAKKGIHTLLPFFPKTKHQFIFSKEEYPGLRGAWRFGRKIHATEKFDLFFSLPDSFSSALIGYASGARKRVGYAKEIRALLMTDLYKRSTGQHRVQEYIQLLEFFTGRAVEAPIVSLKAPRVTKSDQLIININSEASSRRLPLLKSVALINEVCDAYDGKIILIGGKADRVFVDVVKAGLKDAGRLTDLCGQTTLPELAEIMAASRLVLTTDSGPAHLANALGVYTLVLFGAGNENNTAPYNKAFRQIIRLGQLPCEPCVKNTCQLYGIPQCLDQLDISMIIGNMMEKLGKSKDRPANL